MSEDNGTKKKEDTNTSSQIMDLLNSVTKGNKATSATATNTGHPGHTGHVAQQGSQGQQSQQGSQGQQSQQGSQAPQGQQTQQVNVSHGNPNHFSPFDIRRANYIAFSGAILGNALLTLFGVEDENPIPSPESSAFYASGDKLPPSVTGLFDGEMAYGAPVDSMQDAYQRQTSQILFQGIVNYFAVHFNTQSKRKKFLESCILNLNIGKNIQEKFPMQDDESSEEYLERLNTLQFTNSSEQEVPDTPPQVEKVSKAEIKKTKKSKSEKPEKPEKPAKNEKTESETKKSKVVRGKIGKKPAIQVESDTSEEADAPELEEDSGDSELPVSESSESDIELSNESETPKKKTPIKKRLNK